MNLETSYNGTGGTGTASGGVGTDGKYWSLSKLKKSYTSYLSAKNDEISEQKNSRRSYHGAHWTTEEMAALKKRKQPIVTFNRIARKIDGVVGLMSKMRQDPKAFPRTPKHEEGADLATAALRFVMDQQDWKAKDPECARDAAIEGIGGVEITFEDSGMGDRDVAIEVLEPDSFFYDPRSYRMDFSDARYMGVGKWLDIEQAKEMFPDKVDMLSGSSDSMLSSHSDRENKWFMVDGVNKNVRIVDCWYQHNGGWCYSVFCGGGILMEGPSYLIDEKQKQICKYIVFSANIDHDGDRYGFVRNLKSANDEINHRRSKGLHELNTRRIIAEKGAFDDVEVARSEAARPDGVIERNPGFEASFDDTHKLANIEGNFKFLEDAKNEIENFGFNPALVGQGVSDMSGRAIQLQQQAGMAELGPFIMAYRGWKMRVYRAIWNAIQRNWQGERWIRVTDDDNVAQFIQVNGMQRDPMTGLPTLINAIGQLDVDIILDEGADSINMMADAYDTLSVLASKGAQIPPQVLLELAPINSATKKKLLDMMTQPDPMAQLNQQIAQTKAMQQGADAELKQAQTQKTLIEAHLAPQQVQADGLAALMGGQPEGPGEYELPPELQHAQAISDIQNTDAHTAHLNATAAKAQQDAALAPYQMQLDAQNAAEDRALAAKQASQRNRSA